METRRKLNHKEAITIGRTGAASREHFVTTVLRGSTEVTIYDSVRASQTELQRAAREQRVQSAVPERALRVLAVPSHRGVYLAPAISR